MKSVIIYLILFLGIHCNMKSQPAYKIPDNVKKILFLGNSITYSGQYVSYIETYLKIYHPQRHFEIINVGLPSETITGLSEPNHANGRFPRPNLHERLERILNQTKPDLVFACYGMNDGIYLPFDDTRFKKFSDNMQWLHDEVTKTGASIIHLTPPIFDQRKGEAYSNVLDIYSDWLLSRRYTANWDVIDIHWPMKKYLEDSRLKDFNFALAKDGIHPNETGHWIMAKQVLLYLGEIDVVNTEDIKKTVATISNGEVILKLVEDRQKIMKDAWLTAIGHKRPEMKKESL